MKQFILSLVLATSLAFTSCSGPFDDSTIWDTLEEYGEAIKDHEQRISALEELCKQMNTNISSLQTIVEALQNNDYVTAVAPVVKDGITIGYTITFSKSQPVTIYHGEDGKDGANGQDGKDGYTPQIGVKQDKDGVYYWTLDDEWLLDENGNKIKAVGSDGKDGKDGITPQLKIEDDYWYISYDNGATWSKLGKATGKDGKDGQDGANGSDGDSFFQSVTQDEECVYLTLADGTIITLPKHKAEAANCKIYYTTSDGKKLFPNTTEPAIFGAILVSNIYKDGQGILTFDDTITSIGNQAFSGCTSLTSITIPDSVTSIGSSAFSHCTSLTSVDITDLSAWCKISFDGSSANPLKNGAKLYLNGSELTNITIPSDITEIKDYTFYGCTSLTTITIPDSVTSIGGSAFSSCSSLTSVTIGNSVTSIGRAAFEYCTSLTSVTIPDSVTEIGNEAFADCTSLALITIGNSVTSIGDATFWNCTSLTSITIPDSVTSIGTRAFRNCTTLTSVTIPDSVTSIGNDAFRDCTSLKDTYVNIIDLAAYAISNNTYLFPGSKHLLVNGLEITELVIPDSVTSIGKHAFDDCTALTSVIIGSSVTSIGESAFEYCTSLTSVTIPNSVTYIGYFAFDNCTSLTSITIGNSVTSIGSYAFSGCTSLTSVTIPDSVTWIGRSAFEGCTGELTVNCNIPIVYSESYGAFYNSRFTKVTIGNSVTSIGDFAFLDCTLLTRVDISDLSAWCKIDFGGSSANPLCNGAKLYLNGSELTDITIPSDITEIKVRAFSGCTSLTSVTIGNSVTLIGNYAFYNCTSLTSVTIGNSVTSIGEEAFCRCSSLASVTIPDSVTSIEYRAFFDCTSLKEVYCKPITPPAGGIGMFNKNASGRKIYVPTGSGEAYKAKEHWSDYASYIEEKEF